MSPGGLRHSQITLRAAFLLELHNRDRRLGHVLTGETGIVVARGPDTVRGADVAFISYQRLPAGPGADAFLQVPPELVIEVLAKDTSWAKMEEKVADYHALGVDLVWVLDPQTLTLRSFARDVVPVILRGADLASADPQVPGFGVSVSQFFAD